jgi:hypothetical protein
LNRAPSSHVLCSRVRTMSVTILSRERAPTLRPAHSEHFSRSEHHPSSPSSRSSGAAHCCALQRHCRDGPASTDRSASQVTSPVGPSDAFRCSLTRPSVLPCGLTPTDRDCLPRLCSCRASASPISCWIVHGYPPFRGFSPLDAGFLAFPTIARMDAIPPVLHAVSRLAAPRLRGFQPSCGRVLRRSRCSRVRRVAPLLVVSPLRG